MSLKIKKTKREAVSYIKLSELGVGDQIIPPSRYLKYVEKDAVTKKGKKFVSKTFIFQDVETKKRYGVPAFGLLTYLMENEYEVGDCLELIYQGKDDPEDSQSPHQVDIIECQVEGDEVNVEKIKKAQQKLEETSEAEDENDDEDEEYL